VIAAGTPQNWMALVSDAFGGVGGIAQYNRDLLSAVAVSGPGHHIDVLPRHAAKPAIPPQGITQMAPMGRAAFVAAALSLAARKSFDVIFCGHTHLAPLAHHIARMKGAKLIVQTHGIEAWVQLRGAWRRAIERSDLILCVSRYTRRILLGQISIEPERVKVLSNTVGEIFTPGSDFDFRRRHGWENKRILLTVGRLDARERYKGQDRVIAIMPELLAQGHDIVYLIVGDGDDRIRLEQLARNARVEDRVHFLGGLDADRLVEVYRAADLFVMPSTGEGFGISFLEAMACGTPALGLAAGGAPDALGDGALGKIVKEENLCAAVGECLRMPLLDRHSLSQAVRARFGRALFQNSVDGVLTRLHQSNAVA
jgi:phosphatidylinositol alpha-1,6-mannosyltransferase